MENLIKIFLILILLFLNNLLIINGNKLLEKSENLLSNKTTTTTTTTTIASVTEEDLNDLSTTELTTEKSKQINSTERSITTTINDLQELLIPPATVNASIALMHANPKRGQLMKR